MVSLLEQINQTPTVSSWSRNSVKGKRMTILLIRRIRSSPFMWDKQWYIFIAFPRFSVLYHNIISMDLNHKSSSTCHNRWERKDKWVGKTCLTYIYSGVYHISKFKVMENYWLLFSPPLRDMAWGGLLQELEAAYSTSPNIAPIHLPKRSGDSKLRLSLSRSRLLCKMSFWMVNEVSLMVLDVTGKFQ